MSIFLSDEEFDTQLVTSSNCVLSDLIVKCVGSRRGLSIDRGSTPYTEVTVSRYLQVTTVTDSRCASYGETAAITLEGHQ